MLRERLNFKKYPIYTRFVNIRLIQMLGAPLRKLDLLNITNNQTFIRRSKSAF